MDSQWILIFFVDFLWILVDFLIFVDFVWTLIIDLYFFADSGGLYWILMDFVELLVNVVGCCWIWDGFQLIVMKSDGFW